MGLPGGLSLDAVRFLTLKDPAAGMRALARAGATPADAAALARLCDGSGKGRALLAFLGAAERGLAKDLQSNSAAMRLTKAGQAKQTKKNAPDGFKI